MAKDNIAAILISDVHLGALGSNHSQFNSFLKRLIASPNIHLIVAGDFFDLICESVQNLNERSQTTFGLLNNLQNNGVTISEAIGNHEIPVIEPYEAESFSIEANAFQDRLNTMKEHLDAGNNVKQVLDKMILGQYLLLERTDGKWSITPFDSTSNVMVNPSSQFRVLITHGFQLEKKTENLCKLWKDALEAPDDVKDLIDVFFSGTAKSLEDVFKPKNWEQGPDTVKASFNSHRNLRKKGSQARDKLFQFIDENPENLQAYINGFIHSKSKRAYAPIFNDAKNFLNGNPNLKDINYFMFGHTHEVGIDKDSPPTTLVNTGAWQHVKKMTYIELYDDGDLKVKKIRSWTYWMYILLGILLIIGQIMAILGLVYIIGSHA